MELINEEESNEEGIKKIAVIEQGPWAWDRSIFAQAGIGYPSCPGLKRP